MWFPILKFTILAFLIFLLNIGCGRKPEEPKSRPASTEQKNAVSSRASLYLSQASKVQGADGFIDFDHCDALLFSSLYAVGGGRVNILGARDSNGAWHRRSLKLAECYPAHSKSTISRDMFTGLLWWIWENERLDVAEDLFAYGLAHDWVMGEGDPSRTYFTPGLQATLAEMIFQLGGKNYPAYRAIPQSVAKNVGFASHLDILLILLRAEMVGGMGEAELAIVKYNYDRSPRNPLFSYAYHRYTDGDQDETYSALLDERYFPRDRLPNSSDRCEGWILQRDEGSDWQPCGDGKTHSGGDFLFVATLLLRST